MIKFVSLEARDLMVLVPSFQRRDASKFSMRDILNYLENYCSTEHSIISCIIQKTYSDELIAKEDFETNSVFF